MLKKNDQRGLKMNNCKHIYIQGHSIEKDIYNSRRKLATIKLTELICQRCGLQILTNVENLPSNVIYSPQYWFVDALKKFRKRSLLR